MSVQNILRIKNIPLRIFIRKLNAICNAMQCNTTMQISSDFLYKYKDNEF